MWSLELQAFSTENPEEKGSDVVGYVVLPVAILAQGTYYLIVLHRTVCNYFLSLEGAMRLFV
jgi:hypothetical protein